MSWAVQTYKDYSEENTTFSLYFDNVSAGGADWDTIVAAMGAVMDAVDACTYCTPARRVLTQALEMVDQTVPSDEEAQREIGCRVFYADDVNGEIFHFTIPGPHLDTMAMLAGTDRFDLTDEPLASLVSAVEANIQSQYGNSVTVIRAVLVGRRS